jgi:hypothetical protein
MTEIPDLRYVNTNDLFTQIITTVGAILAGITLGFTITSYMIYPIKCTSNNNTQTDDDDHARDEHEHDHEEIYSDKIGGRCRECECCDCLHCAVSDPSSDGDGDGDGDGDDDDYDDDYDYEQIDKLDETDFDECEQKKRDFITFSNLFFNKLSKMETRDLSQTEIENLRLKTVESDSPYGKIIMTYNSDTDSFWWYSAAQQQQQQQHSFYIPYKILDTIARLFAITYNCKKICVNYKEEWEKERQLVLEDIEKKQMEAEENKTVMSDAIHFKNYPICVSTLNRFTNKYNLHELVPATKKKVNEDDDNGHYSHHNNNNNNKIKYSDFKQNIHLLNKKTD